jgi:GMP reductase
MNDIKLDFDDVLIVPQFSDITSRNQVDLVTTINGKWGASITGVPIIAANMDGVGTFSMAKSLAEFNMFTAITKQTPIEMWFEQYDINSAFITIGMNDNELEKTLTIINYFSEWRNCDNFVPKIVIDVANGYMNPFYEFIEKVRNRIPDAFIMAGTVTTPEAVQRVINSGADLARVGIGTGAVCTTRRVAGVGYPLFSALSECVPAADEVGGGVQSDGGCVYPGDFAKAFAIGAQMVMSGSVFAGHEESEQEIHDGKVIFYGMSSKAAQKKHNQYKEYRASEGRVVQLPYKGLVEHTVSDILGGIRSACAYVGAKNTEELSNKAKFIRVNNVLNRSLEKFTLT